MVRVATYINTMPAAIHMIEDAKEKDTKLPAISWRSPMRRRQIWILH